jgi:hypothetical protein
MSSKMLIDIPGLGLIDVFQLSFVGEVQALRANCEECGLQIVVNGQSIYQFGTEDELEKSRSHLRASLRYVATNPSEIRQ